VEQDDLDIITTKVRLKFMSGIDEIADGLVVKACEGNYNAAKLLLLLSGLQPAFEEVRTPPTPKDTPYMFLLELLHQVVPHGNIG